MRHTGRGAAGGAASPPATLDRRKPAPWRTSRFTDLVLHIPARREDWISNIRGDVLAGLVVALALIPEAIAFSIIAGVDPKNGLYASFCIAVVIAFAGGRPG